MRRETPATDFKVSAAKITPEATFRGTLGLDSLDAVDLIYLVGKTFGIKARVDSFAELHTVLGDVHGIQDVFIKPLPVRPAGWWREGPDVHDRRHGVWRIGAPEDVHIGVVRGWIVTDQGGFPVAGSSGELTADGNCEQSR